MDYLSDLTPRERQVFDLIAAQQLTNPQIAAALSVSRETVKTHVSRILLKLGFGTRVELRAAWLAHKDKNGHPHIN